MIVSSFVKKIVLLIIFACSMYGLSVLYYAVTAGFTIGNVTSTLPYDPRWDLESPPQDLLAEINGALAQEYSYLGKGCQSYVFGSDDGEYVVKFIKFQRFRPQVWIDLFSFIPTVESYQERKAIEKREKLDKLFTSWKLAYRFLRDQTGIVFVHLNKFRGPEMPVLTIRDKMGLKHDLDLNGMEFLVQRRATMLEDNINEMVKIGEQSKAGVILDKLIAMLIWEYERGFADNDHALMQNTGVLEGRPIHIDVGQFIRNDIVRDPGVYKQEIYNKTFLLRKWLDKTHPDLAYHLKARLIDILGMDYYYMAPYVHKGDVGKIPNAY